ncbi:SagB/ThcOx family dehydrogenase [Hydrogenophaga sp. A37]|uniref:SagB/ThcOx family dehydrogenase n=1 Tax=Hydrogenophaga sp. A37 TaxID=1945864 RepID=UPI00098634E8|nr:SagB/ThcOx family dehydrogenase [Hydrogenophaga sp. A37]OOG81374.1 nitroreductase [Hydrogenophaga sp. A37]
MAETVTQVSALAHVQSYHERSKHRLGAYAAGPETLDWDAQPDPFRRFAGAPLTPLPLDAAEESIGWNQLFEPGREARSANLAQIGRLFELSFALSAWKELGPDRWALRINPSSGNLHPTEVYLVTQGLPDLTDGVYHYAPKEHALELRAAFDGPATAPRLLVGFSSIHWREAWKYGERAFRYCQLDMGHAIGALRYAAALLGWRVRELGLGHVELAALMGLDRAGDFLHAEGEEDEAVFELCFEAINTPPLDLPEVLAGASWFGQANRLDAHPMYRWPVIDAVAQASRRLTAKPTPALPAQARRTLLPSSTAKASQLIRQRRSAQRFDRSARTHTATLWPLLTALMPAGQLPWDMGQDGAQVHAVLFAHRVDGLAPGAYLLPRNITAQARLQAALPQLTWKPVDRCPADIPLVELAPNPALAGTLRALSCHQAIAADAVFVIALLAELPSIKSEQAWLYSDRLREAGLIGQVLYLEAEAAGLRGTGIGCFFDDPVRELLGLGAPGTEAWQVLYHFSVGLPVADARIASTPPYPEPRP